MEKALILHCVCDVLASTSYYHSFYGFRLLYFFACLIQVFRIQCMMRISLSFHYKKTLNLEEPKYLWFKGVTSYAVYLLHRV